MNEYETQDNYSGHISRLKKLMSRLEKFHIMLDNDVALDMLEANAPPDGKKWSVYLKVDAGGCRGKLFLGGPPGAC